VEEIINTLRAAGCLNFAIDYDHQDKIILISTPEEHKAHAMLTVTRLCAPFVTVKWQLYTKKD